MSRQPKDHSDKPSTQRDSNLEKQIRSDQLIALQAQLDWCQQEKRQLIQSRNYAIIIAVLATLAAFYQFFIKPPVDCTSQQQALVARQLSAHKKQLTEQKCIEDTIKQATIIDDEDSIAQDVRQTLSKIDSKLYGKTQVAAGENENKNNLSSVLDRLDDSGTGQSRTTQENKKAISRMLKLWAFAWELKDLSTYFSYYSKNFDPQAAASNLQEWKAKRSYRIENADNIKITIQDLIIKHLDEDNATVSFNQQYQAQDYADTTHKLVELVREDGRWLILRENSFTAKVNLKR